MIEDDLKFVVNGPPPVAPLPKISLGKLIYDSLLTNSDNKEAMINVSTHESISFQQIFEKSLLLAEALRQKNCAKNTVVALCSENNLQFFIPVISCLYIGAIVAPLNPNYTPEETTHVLNTSKPKIIFCSKAVSQKCICLKNELTYIERIVIIDSQERIEGAETLDDFILRSLSCYPCLYQFELAEIDPENQVAFIMCSSGTTGLPKGVMQTHSNFLVHYMRLKDPSFNKNSDKIIGYLPFFHSYGLLINFYGLLESQQILVIQKFTPEIFLQTIQNYQISQLWLVPSLVVLLTKSPLVEKYNLSSVKVVNCGASVLNKSTEEALKNRLKLDTIRQGYGLTEVTTGVIAVSLFDKNPKFGSSGQVLSYTSCKIRDPETGRTLGPGQVGELCFKGPMVMKGYFGNIEATRNSFTKDGWLLTGDLGYYDENKYFYIVDRLKELIKYKGYQVPPAEIEAILLNNSKIKDAGVVGLPDEEAGELPLAFVVKNIPDLSEIEVVNFVNEKVSSQKRLRGGVIFIEEIPKNSSGKILRKELRKMLAEMK